MGKSQKIVLGVGIAGLVLLSVGVSWVIYMSPLSGAKGFTTFIPSIFLQPTPSMPLPPPGQAKVIAIDAKNVTLLLDTGATRRYEFTQPKYYLLFRKGPIAKAKIADYPSGRLVTVELDTTKPGEKIRRLIIEN